MEQLRETISQMSKFVIMLQAHKHCNLFNLLAKHVDNGTMFILQVR